MIKFLLVPTILNFKVQNPAISSSFTSYSSSAMAIFSDVINKITLHVVFVMLVPHFMRWESPFHLEISISLYILKYGIEYIDIDGVFYIKLLDWIYIERERAILFFIEEYKIIFLSIDRVLNRKYYFFFLLSGIFSYGF